MSNNNKISVVNSYLAMSIFILDKSQKSRGKKRKKKKKLEGSTIQCSQGTLKYFEEIFLLRKYQEVRVIGSPLIEDNIGMSFEIMNVLELLIR